MSDRSLRANAPRSRSAQCESRPTESGRDTSIPTAVPVAQVHLLPIPLPDELPTEVDVSLSNSISGEVWLYAPSWLASMVVHLLLVLLLALLTVVTAGSRYDAPLNVLVQADGGPYDGEPEMISEATLEAPADFATSDPLLPAPLAELPPTATELGPTVPILLSGELAATGAYIDSEALLAGAGGNSLSLRLNDGLRQSLVQAGGGTPQSEEAVRLALQWLADHQEYDGGWSFQHHKHPKCNNQCSSPGYTPGRIAATGIALLPFLGTGQTQFQGTHKQTIERGLKFLVRSTQQKGNLGSLWDPHGTMYGHGLASIALCEAYGMTQDQSLRKPAQSVVNFIVEAQDPVGGGWRYHPNTPGDTSVVGWQLMALKSAQMAYLRVPPVTLHKTTYFLDSVQGEKGATYGYQLPESRRPATSAIGLLCRMYLGWDHDHRGLARGVRMLGQIGPSTDKSSMRNNLYYNYYATQVLHHWGGDEWKRWNAVMRDYLVNSQATQGHELGSWHFNGSDHGSGAAGRLYCTAMSAMILEVYYRHMPLYREQVVLP